MHRHVVAHGNQVGSGRVGRLMSCVRGEDGGGVVAALFDVGREGGAAKGRAHFDGDGVECVTDDGDFSGIRRSTYGHARAPALGVRRRLECASTVAVQFDGRNVVALSSTMTAGPMMRWPEWR